ncbi:ABC-three component system protein [Citrobacter amalonaticus]|uniref:ABC-three component system protein n=1 Tax=Citrobacter amalonaticus TaxID=35703 RepID=UPI00076B4E09|nr:ABC-three component system protein [Citrobacter amalonaticus]AWV28195.1 hypothetical protein CD187_19110 [Citrobacter youngae]AMG93447.1 hypothetical protein AL479_13590 [Citrobacter amalonaticus]EGT3575626.1 hypothetical protein [Citrobacter amalonaticus]HED1256992.1 hypothetical protein [Citrobacter amalonaticus]HED1257358.1 hypothetical protein [Citrobacter amalonaticus]
MSRAVNHTAEGAALGFYYQSLYALKAILENEHDDAALCLERLDDVEIVANGESLLSQLKHSIKPNPASVTITSTLLWKTFKVWIDLLPKINLDETRLQLITVAPVGNKDELFVLTQENSDRELLLLKLIDEATRVVEEHEHSLAQKKVPAPHVQRYNACKSFLELQKDTRKELLGKVVLFASEKNISNISKDIESKLTNFPPSKRELICQRLLEWWDLQVIFSLCGKRERVIYKLEVQQRLSEISGELERDELNADFENAILPSNYNPHSMIVNQIELIKGRRVDISQATREEWRARSQRHKWCNERFDMASRIDQYDKLLLETWSDKYERMAEECEDCEGHHKEEQGYQLFRWSFDLAHTQIRSFAPNWNASYYVRGTYQLLSIELKVGWHPDYKGLLRDKK